MQERENFYVSDMKFIPPTINDVCKRNQRMEKKNKRAPGVR